MKRTLFTILIVSLLAISVTGCTSTENATTDTADEAASPATSAPSPADGNTTGIGNIITMEEAKEIALTDAGLTEANVTFVKTELDTDNGRQEYEIEFYSGNKEYDYEIARVPGATESNIRLHLDTEDGVAVYEGSIVYNNVEYEFEIDAATGKIVKWSSEPVFDD